MPKFFNYPEVITEELNQMGYNVDFFDDRPSTSGWVKAIIRINKDYISSYIRRYFDKMMSIVSRKKYDVVLLISGQSLAFSEDMIKKLKSTQSQARFVLYQWDSLENFPYIENLQKYFDKCYSFDKRDCKQCSQLRFLPLFYSKQYENLGKKSQENNYVYDFCFVGTAHPKKYRLVNDMSNKLKEIYPKQFIYYFFPSRLVYFYRKMKNKEFKNAKYTDFHYTPLKGPEMDAVFHNSRCVLDSPQDGQIGLTMRVFEALGAKKKLITTNSDIANYDFFRPENIYIYTGDFDFDNVFFKKDYVGLDFKIYRKYSLNRWLKELVD